MLGTLLGTLLAKNLTYITYIYIYIYIYIIYIYRYKAETDK